MNEEKTKRLLLINGFGSPTTIIDELLSGETSDSNIYLSYPLGILTLAGWCRQELPGFNIRIIDAMMELHKHKSQNHAPTTLSAFIAEMLSRIESTPDYIGISIGFSNGHRPCLEICRQCKEKWPESVVIAGGVHATTFTPRLIGDPCIDFIIRGPGDTAFVDLLKALVDGRTPDAIPGVVKKNGNLAAMASPLENLDSIPHYPYDLIDMEYLVVNESTNPVQSENARTGVIFMSRGCPFGCTYCAADKVHGRKVRFKSVERMVLEVKYLIDTFHVNTISIIDDLFGADKAYFYDFFQHLDKLGMQFRLVVPGGLSIAVFDEEMIDALALRGLGAVYFPLESGCEYVQKEIIKKRVNLEKAVRLIRYCKSKRLFVGINIILGHPGETREMMDETYRFIRDLPVDAVAFFAAYPYPGTAMTEKLLGSGVINEEQLLEIWDSATQGFKERPFDTPEISGKELAKLIYDYNMELNFFSNYAIRTGDYDNALMKLNKIIERYPFHIGAIACRALCFSRTGHEMKARKDAAAIAGLVEQNAESRRLMTVYGEKIHAILRDGGLHDMIAVEEAR